MKTNRTNNLCGFPNLSFQLEVTTSLKVEIVVQTVYALLQISITSAKTDVPAKKNPKYSLCPQTNVNVKLGVHLEILISACTVGAFFLEIKLLLLYKFRVTLL